MGTRQVAVTPDANVVAAPNYSKPLAIVTTLFFMWGFLTCLNDILIPHLKSIFDLSYARVMLIQFAFFSAYFLFSVPWSRIVNTIGYKTTMVVGLLTMALGAFLFIPAASAVSFPISCCSAGPRCSLACGFRQSLRDLLGKPETASSRLDLTQAFNSLGTTIAPKIGGGAAPLAVERDSLRQRLCTYATAGRIRKAFYTVIGIALLLLALLVHFEVAAGGIMTGLPDTEGKRSIWRHQPCLYAIGILPVGGSSIEAS